MNLKKIAAVGAAIVMSAGVFSVVPISGESNSFLAVTAEAADSDFVIENGVLTGYNGKGGDIIIPSGVKSIGKRVFAENQSIVSVTFPKSCTEIKGYGSIDGGAFEKCINLKKVVFEGDIRIGMYAFFGCTSLESVTIKGSVERIEEMAFKHCKSLKTFKIEKNNIEFSIMDDAFANCAALTYINIPDKCKEIGGHAFENCFSLETLTIPKNTELGRQSIGYSFLSVYYVYGYYVADGKTSGLYFDAEENKDIEVTPKQLTVYVTKGSPAEKYCKENGIKYAYGSAPAVITQPTTTIPPAAAPKLAAPTGIKGTVSSDKIVLTWNEVNGAEAYRVYKYDEKSGKYLKYKDVKSAKCTISGLKANTKYKFKVYALVSEKGQFAPQTPSTAFSFKTKAKKTERNEPVNTDYITL